MVFRGVNAQTSEWPAALDILTLLTNGFQPTPFRQFVLKLTERCDLACDYCYVFALADQGWRTKPARMSSAVVEQTAERIARYVAHHSLPSVDVVLHGGEPLLIGADGVDFVATVLRRALPQDVHLDLGVQTNGLRLDDDLLQVLATHRIRVGISLDGDATAHDRHRRRPNGQGSYVETSQAIRRLTTLHPNLFGGLLCTIDVRNDPLTTYQALRAYSPPVIDLLLPHATWSLPPPGVPDPAAPNRSTPYGDWLVAIFDHWYPIAPQEPTIRLFYELARLLLGGDSQTETIGLSPATVVVIDTDGAIEQVDTLRAAFAEATSLGLSWPANSDGKPCAPPAVPARSTPSAEPDTTRTATAQDQDSSTPACTAPTCNASSDEYMTRFPRT
jgi:uncharacterized protein